MQNGSGKRDFLSDKEMGCLNGKILLALLFILCSVMITVCGSSEQESNNLVSSELDDTVEMRVEVYTE